MVELARCLEERMRGAPLIADTQHVARVRPGRASSSAIPTMATRPIAVQIHLWRGCDVDKLNVRPTIAGIAGASGPMRA